MNTLNLQTQAFSSNQAREVTGITSRQLNYWDKTGLVKPSVNSASGRGSQRLYSYKDLLALKIVKTLLEDHSLQKVRKCISYLRKHLPDASHPLNSCTLVTENQSVYLVTGEKELVDTVRNQGQLYLLKLDRLDRELRSRVLKLRRKQVYDLEFGDFAYQVEIEPDEDGAGYVVEVAGLPGCITQGDTIEEALVMAKDAIGTYLEAVDDLKRRGVKLPIQRQKARRKARA
ncbi:MAG: MerR family transcriptional regulator [Phycisphaerae bacterium]|jgi:predicted RNase H-like HicB family nuclease